MSSDVYSIFTLQDMHFLIPFPDEDFPPEKKPKNISRDYNRFHPGWSPNSAYNSGYSFTDINIGEFYTQSMAISNIN